MWGERVIKIIPALLFLLCVLQIFELALIVTGMNETEKLEARGKDNLKALENITILSNEHLECMGLEHSKDKGIKTE